MKKKKSKKHPTKDHTALDPRDACEQENRVTQQDEGPAQEEQEPAPAPHNQGEVPQSLHQGAQPKKTRSGRETVRPSALAYQKDFTQHETRDLSPKFRIPNAAAPKPPKPPKPPTDV